MTRWLVGTASCIIATVIAGFTAAIEHNLVWWFISLMFSLSTSFCYAELVNLLTTKQNIQLREFLSDANLDKEKLLRTIAEQRDRLEMPRNEIDTSVALPSYAFPPRRTGPTTPAVFALAMRSQTEIDTPRPLSDCDIQMIHAGLLIPNAKAILSMSREIRKWRCVPNPDSI